MHNETKGWLWHVYKEPSIEIKAHNEFTINLIQETTRDMLERQPLNFPGHFGTCIFFFGNTSNIIWDQTHFRRHLGGCFCLEIQTEPKQKKKILC